MWTWAGKYGFVSSQLNSFAILLAVFCALCVYELWF
jgi:hypothetical protein